ncbi:fibronectin type III domain-containing protein [Spirosoma sp. BT702]|uniref:Fibronectin type III domain-containing protein n=1 Tax=Spirosoma profusum TaxID=2771354 RepID=A0A927AMZ9_9BACT|nr:fibronectin type III domain-containing protein [Spirosoma profusum]MBD2700829.1 fibronectin type III domain-containing protein [Spirosoma profusum]
MPHLYSSRAIGALFLFVCTLLVSPLLAETPDKPVSLNKASTLFACGTPVSPFTNSIAPANARLNWTNAPGNSSPTIYEVQYRAVDNNVCTGNTTVSANPWVSWPTSTTSTTNLLLTGLTSNTCYQWRVRASCTDLTFSDYTTPVAFKTLECSTPTNPNVISAFSNSANLQWFTPALGGRYEVQYRQQNTIPWNTISDISGTPSAFNQAQISYILRGLTPSTAYQFQVRVICSATSSSTFTSPVNFTTTSCAAPTSGSSFGATATSVTLSWSPSPTGSLGFNLRYRTAAGPGAYTTVSGISSAPYALTGLTPSTAYEFQVESICSTTSTSGFGNTFNFSTPGCNTPSLSSAVVTPTTARLAWTPTATSYTVEYRAMAAGQCFSNTTSPANPWTTAASGLTANNTVLPGLTEGTCYQWRVIATCASSFTSSTGYFTTACGQSPGGLSTNPIAGTSAQLNWNNLGSGVQYEVQWRANLSNAITGDGGCMNNTTSTENPWTTISNISTNNVTLTGLNISTCYQWKVKVLCTGSNFSDPVVFRTTDCIPVAIAQQPATSATVVAGSTATASVSATGSSLTYQWYKDGTAPGNIVAGQTSATLTLSNVQFSQAGTYYVQVSNGCSSTISTGFTLVVTTSAGCVGGFFTVQNGAWNTPATWSCGSVPTSADAVEIRHIVNVPESYTGLSQKITYTNGGKIVIANTGKVRVGP